MEFRDLKKQYQKYNVAIKNAIERVASSGLYIGGEEVKNIEEKLAKYVGVKNCISCANGTDALTLVLMAWEISIGDAVFVPDFTFFATAEVVSLRGATPIFVDVDPDTFNIDPIDLENKILHTISETKLTPKVIIPVDLFGLPADYDKINDIADRYGLKILEDGAQGFGGSIGSKKVCSFGHAATTSFFPAKPLGCYGDGGAIFTNDDELSMLINSIKVHGKGIDKYDNVRIGLNSRLDPIQAAILDIKFDAFVAHELSDVNMIFRRYDEKLSSIVKTPTIPSGYMSSFAQFTIVLRSKNERDALQKHLESMKIPTMIYYSKPLHKQIVYSDFNYPENFCKNASALAEVVLSLPMHPYLTINEVDFICEVITEYILRNNQK